MKIKFPHPIWITAFVSACTVGPNFNESDIITQKYFLPPTEDTQTTTATIQHELESIRQTLFSAVALQETLQQALKDNYDIAKAKASLAEAESALQSYRGNLLPQIALGGGISRKKYGVATFGPSEALIPPFTAYEVGPTVGWTFDLFGGTRKELERQRALADYQQCELNAAYLRIAGNVVIQATEIAAIKSEIAEVETILMQDHAMLRLSEIAWEAGSGTKTDILQAQNRFQKDSGLLPPLQQRLHLAEHLLAILMGQTPIGWQPPNFHFSQFQLPTYLPTQIPSEILRNRPDILAAEANLHAASAAIGVATANLYPQISISATTMQESLTLMGLFNTAHNAWSMAGNMTMPLWNNGRLKAEKAKAEHAYEAALAQYQQTVLLAFRQVADTLTALAHNSDAIAIQQQSLNNAKNTLALAEITYNAGASGLLPIQEARRQLAEDQRTLIHLQQDQYLTAITLFMALGELPTRPPTRGMEEDQY